jgi:predicted nuclease of predicted toxin-antitoxin system
VKFFVDENLSPRLAAVCQERGYDATCCRDRGMLSADDRDQVVPLLFAEERIIVSEDWDDFQELFDQEGVHHGIVAMPARRLEVQQNMMTAAIAFIETAAAAANELPSDYMVNRAVHVDEDGNCETFFTGEELESE